jgi:hypothetical protein
VELRLREFENNSNSNFNNNLTFSNNSNWNTNSNINDINDFINDYPIRNRLGRLNPSQINNNDNHRLNVHEMASFYTLSNRNLVRSNPTFIQNSRSNSNFKLTLMIIMVPFIGNNKTVTIETEK